jgi:hypothetical protein
MQHRVKEKPCRKDYSKQQHAKGRHAEELELAHVYRLGGSLHYALVRL